MKTIAIIVFSVASVFMLSACDKISDVANNQERKLVGATPAPVAKSDPNAEAIKTEFARQQAEEAKAIELAKKSNNLLVGVFYAAKPDPNTITNEYQIAQQMSRVKGDITIIGWRAIWFDADTYLVTYTYNHRTNNIIDNETGWPFEVKVNEGVVRYVLGDPELEKKYGWKILKKSSKKIK
jgi:hypothetical protein